MLSVTDQSQFAFGLMALQRVVEEQLRPPSTLLGCKGQLSAESTRPEGIAPKSDRRLRGHGRVAEVACRPPRASGTQDDRMGLWPSRTRASPRHPGKDAA